MRGKWTIGVFAAVTKSLRKAEAWKCSILLDDTAKRGRYLGQIARLGHIILGIDAEVSRNFAMSFLIVKTNITYIAFPS